MQPNATNQHQRHLYQKQLLQQQHQQMSQFHIPTTSMNDSTAVQVQSPISIGAPLQQHQPPGSTAFAPTTRLAAGSGTASLASSSRMGPPNHHGSGSMSSFTLSQQAAAGPSNGQSTSYFGPGAGLARLHQYSEALKEGSNRQSCEYWKSFVDEFYLPQSTMHLILCNASTREQKAFEVPSSVVARWMQTNYISGVVSSSMSMESPREFMTGQPFPPPPRSVRADFHLPSGNVTHFVECKRSLYINQFDSGWQVQMTGLLRAALVPHTRVLPSATTEESAGLQTHLRLECLEFLVSNHRSFLPTTARVAKSVEEKIPKSVIRTILVSHGHPPGDSGLAGAAKVPKMEDEGGEEDDGSEFTIKVNELSLPESPVNEYGITLRAMRCLEITESVCQLRDLMDFSMTEKERSQGPIEGLRRLTAQYRERDGRLGVSNALHFDPNTSGMPGNDVQGPRADQFDSHGGENGNPMALGGEMEMGEEGGGNAGGQPSGTAAHSPKVGGSPNKRQR